MARERQNNFGAGEISPSLYGRTDLAQYAAGTRKLTNFLVSKYGTLLTRSGSRYVGAASSASVKSRLFTFDFSDNQQYCIEVSGSGYIQVHGSDGSPVGRGRYIAAGAVTAGGIAVSRTSAPAEDPTGTWVEASTGLTTVASYISSDSSPTLTVMASSSMVAYTADGGATWTEYAHGKVDGGSAVVIRSVCYFDGTWYLVGYGAAGNTLRVYTSATAASGSWAIDASFSSVAVTPTWGVRAKSCASSMIIVPLVTGSSPPVYLRSPGGTWVACVGYSLTGTLAPQLLYSHGMWSLMHYDGNDSSFRMNRTVEATGQSFQADTGNTVALGGDFALASNGAVIAGMGGGTALSRDGGLTWSYGTHSFGAVDVRDAMWCTDRFVFVGGSYGKARVWSWKIGESMVEEFATASFAGAIFYTLALDVRAAYSPQMIAPWAEADLPYLRAHQSGDMVIFTCYGYPPYAVSRLATSKSPLAWEVAVYFDAVPTGLVTGLAASVAPGAGVDVDHPGKEWSWQVAWEDRFGMQGQPSAALSVSNTAVYEDRPISITWTAYPGAARYHVYRGRNGVYGWVGATTTTTFNDDGQLPIVVRQPRTWLRPYAIFPPAVSCFYQDRLAFANQVLKPADVRLSAVGDYQNFDEKTDFIAPDDALLFQLAARRFEDVRAMVPVGKAMLVLTGEQEWALRGVADAGVSADSYDLSVISSRGIAWVAPVVVGQEVLAVQRQGSVIFVVGGPPVSDTSQHLFDGYTVLEVHYSSVPYSTVWVVRSDGRLLSMAYYKEAGVFAWSEHYFLDPDGTEADVESATVVNESGEEVLWLAMKRVVGGATVRYIERMAPRNITSAAAACTLDCATTYSGAATTSLAVPQFAEGDVISYWAGGVKGTATVSGGAITIPSSTVACAGVAFSAVLTTLDSKQALVEQKIVPRVWVETDAAEWTWVDATVGIEAGNDTGGARDTVHVKDKVDGLIEILIDSVTNPGGRVTVQVDDPIPVEIRGIIREVTPGQ